MTGAKLAEIADEIERLGANLKDAQQGVWDATARNFPEVLKATAVRDAAQVAFNHAMVAALPAILTALRRPEPAAGDVEAVPWSDAVMAKMKNEYSDSVSPHDIVEIMTELGWRPSTVAPAALRPADPGPGVEAWRNALVSLTPGCDRFKDKPDECAAWVKQTFEAQDRMLSDVEIREKKLNRDVAKLQEQVKTALVDSENRLADLLEARANGAAERGAGGEYMITMDIALHVRSGVLTRRATLPPPAAGDARAEVEREIVAWLRAEGLAHKQSGLLAGHDWGDALYRAALRIEDGRYRTALAQGQTGDALAGEGEGSDG